MLMSHSYNSRDNMNVALIFVGVSVQCNWLLLFVNEIFGFGLILIFFGIKKDYLNISVN